MSNEIKIKIESTSPVSDPVHLKTVKYDNLSGKPKINGVELVGDKSTADLKIEVDTTKFATKDELNGKANKTDIPNVSNYLPLSGGTMTGGLSVPALYSSNNKNADIGDADHFFRAIYLYDHIIKVTSFGPKYFSLPDESGTLARTEDIDAAVGDISTALTAILGE